MLHHLLIVVDVHTMKQIIVSGEVQPSRGRSADGPREGGSPSEKMIKHVVVSGLWLCLAVVRRVGAG